MCRYQRHLCKRGFTLIELLIVIAIILILIAIALPNFLEAQERARVTRAKAQLRTMETAIFMHVTDYGFIYADFNDNLLVKQITRNKRQGAMEPCGVNALPVSQSSSLTFIDPNSKGTLTSRPFYSPNIHCPLTTPIKYIDSQYTTDPWGDGTIPIGMDSREIGEGDIPGRKLSQQNGSTLVYAAYFVSGPDGNCGDWLRGCDTTRKDKGIGCAYSATNGTKSQGELWMVISTVDTAFAKREYDPLKTF